MMQLCLFPRCCCCCCCCRSPTKSIKKSTKFGENIYDSPHRSLLMKTTIDEEMQSRRRSTSRCYWKPPATTTAEAAAAAAVAEERWRASEVPPVVARCGQEATAASRAARCAPTGLWRLDRAVSAIGIRTAHLGWLVGRSVGSYLLATVPSKSKVRTFSSGGLNFFWISWSVKVATHPPTHLPTYLPACLPTHWPNCFYLF